jgi:hypothetical protein
MLPHDETMLAARTDIEVVNQSLALSIRATSSLVNIAECLHARRLELNTQVLIVLSCVFSTREANFFVPLGIW